MRLQPEAIHLRSILHDAITAQKKVLVVFGNGINEKAFGIGFRRLDNLLAEIRGSRDPRPPTRTEQTTIWALYEVLRDYSANEFPPVPLILISYLVSLGVVYDVLTPSYDLFFNSLLEKIGGHRYSLNPMDKPVSKRRHDGYGVLRTNDDKRNVRLFKYHGDLGFARFDKCGDIFRLPRYPILPLAGLADPVKRLLPSLKNIGSWSGNPHYHTDQHGSSAPAHFIDFNYPSKKGRKNFIEEIGRAQQAIDELSPPTTAGVIIFGFAGRWHEDEGVSSEEIVPQLLGKVRSGLPTSMIVLSKEQALVESPLARAVHDVSDRQLWQGDVTACLSLVFGSIRELLPALGRVDSLLGSGRFRS